MRRKLKAVLDAYYPSEYARTFALRLLVAPREEQR